MEKANLERAINTFKQSLAEMKEIRDKGIRSKVNDLYEDYKIAVESMEMRMKLELYMKDGGAGVNKNTELKDT